jgi:hypothetical protein
MPIWELKQYLKLLKRHNERKTEEEASAASGRSSSSRDGKTIGQVSPPAHPI